jgi:DcuC family C4-dicarboxylate transporter
MIRSLTMLILSFSYLLSVFIPSDFLQYLLSFSTFSVLLFTLLVVKGVSRFSSIVLVTIGTFIFIYFNMDLNTYLSAYAKNASLLTLFILVPLISIPLRIGGYLDAISNLYSLFIKSKNQLYLFSSSLTYLLSIILNVGSVFIVYNLTNAEKKSNIKPSVIRALLRGYPLSIYWSPYFVSVALIISYFPISWLQIFLVGALLSLVNLFIGYYIETAHNKKGNNDSLINKEEKSLDLDGYQYNVKKVKELLLIGVSLTFFILLLERLTHIKIITLVPLLAILSVFLWTLYLRKVSKLKLEFKNYFMSDLPRMKNEMALFISAGFFGESIFQAGLSDHIISLIQYLGITHAYELSLFLYVSVILLSFIGIHPFVSVTTFSISFIGTDLLVRNEWIIAISLLSAWPITTTTSPFSGLVLYMSSLTSQSPFKVGLKQNWRHALFVSISSLLIINLIHYL